jgi:hypothetical protein
MKALIPLLAIAIAGCVNVDTKPSTVAVEETSPPPQLWSHHEFLEISAEECSVKGFRALQSLSYTDVVKNGNYSYGNYASNRAAVKCVENGKASFVYVMVAGPDRKVAEKLRNELAWQFD